MNVQDIAKRLAHLGDRESTSVARILFEQWQNSDSSEDVLKEMISRVVSGEPVQYVVGHAWFYGRKFAVNSNVLIPRPETEELVYWIVQDYKGKGAFSVLDIGAGSGCIAGTLAKEMSHAGVTALDISTGAIKVARSNFAALNVAVETLVMDYLTTKPDATYDVIVSNPPYVSFDEFNALDPSVSGYEPRLALGHASGDPDIFYREIAGSSHLKPNGAIYLELNEFRTQEIEEIFKSSGYQTEMRKDMQGKDRMLKAWR